jgi:hypothetical protein
VQALFPFLYYTKNIPSRLFTLQTSAQYKSAFIRECFSTQITTYYFEISQNTSMTLMYICTLHFPYSVLGDLLFDVLTSIVLFYTGPQSRGGVAYGVTSLQANRNTVTKASRRGVVTSTRWRHIMDTTTTLLRKQQDGGTSWIS